jgi:hypothetical protein
VSKPVTLAGSFSALSTEFSLMAKNQLDLLLMLKLLMMTPSTPFSLKPVLENTYLAALW